MFNYTDADLDKTTLKAAIARRFHDERISAGYTLEELAEKLHRGKPTVQSWEKGWEQGTGLNHIPDLNQLMDVCHLYKCTPEYMLCEYDFKSQQQTDIALETGLLPESITRLQKYMSGTKSDNEYVFKTSFLNLKFINFFIGNMDQLEQALIDRVNLTDSLRKFMADPDHEILLIAKKEVKETHPNKDIFGAHDSSLNMACYHAVLESLSQHFDDKQRVNQLMGKFMQYYSDVLSDFRSRQSDFIFSEIFIDFIKDFFEDKPGLQGANYKDFLDIAHG